MTWGLSFLESFDIVIPNTRPFPEMEDCAVDYMAGPTSSIHSLQPYFTGQNPSIWPQTNCKG